MAVAACIKGYYYALRKSFMPSSAQVIEQIVKMAFIMVVIQLWLPYGDEYACAAAVLGMTVGEISSCVYADVCILQVKPKRKSRFYKRRVAMKTILQISLPIQFSSTFHSLLRLAENLMIIAGLKVFSGGDGSQAIGLYGILKGWYYRYLPFQPHYYLL